MLLSLIVKPYKYKSYKLSGKGHEEGSIAQEIFFYSLEKNLSESMGELMKRMNKSINLDHASRVKRHQDPRFNKKRAVKGKTQYE